MAKKILNFTADDINAKLGVVGTMTWAEMTSSSPLSNADAINKIVGVRAVYGTGTMAQQIVGIVSIFADNLMHAVYEVFVSTISDMSSGAHGGDIHTWYRRYNITNTHGTVGTWSSWYEKSAIAEWEDATGYDIESFTAIFETLIIQPYIRTETAPTLRIGDGVQYKYTNPLTSLTIEVISDNTTESLVMFTTGANVTNFLTLPSGTKIVGEINIEANKSYVMSILRGIVVIGEVTTN